MTTTNLFRSNRRAPKDRLVSFLAFGKANGSVEKDELSLADIAVRIATERPEGIEFLLGFLPFADEARLKVILIALAFVREKLSSKDRAALCLCSDTVSRS